MSSVAMMRLTLFAGLRPVTRAGALRDAFAGVTLASMNIPQVLGYTRIAGTPIVTGLYTVLLPLVAFAAFGSSCQLVLAAGCGARPHGGATLAPGPRPRRVPAHPVPGVEAVLVLAVDRGTSPAL
jgi:MFS superfamily sulfate permease-like transporter